MTSFLYVVSYCHLSATLQTISIIVINLQDNRAVIGIVIALLRFSFDFPSLQNWHPLNYVYQIMYLTVSVGVTGIKECFFLPHMSLWTSWSSLLGMAEVSVTDFWGWDAYEAQLRCPDDVSGDIGGCSARRALKPKFYQPTQTMVTAGILPFRENSHSIAGNRTRNLMISRQRLWLLDHEAGRY